MLNLDELIAIIDRIAENRETPDDIALLRQSIQIVGNVVQSVTQAGEHNINIGQISGGEVHIGDRIYQLAAVQEVLLSSAEKRSAMLKLLEAIEARFNTVTLFHTREPIVLKDQYIPIQVTLERRSDKVVENFFSPVSEAELSRAYALKRGEEESAKREQVDWQQAKQQHSRLMVLADPGMGKSTLLRMEALTMAQREREKLRSAEVEAIELPLLVRLSELAERSEELIEAIPLLIQRDYQAIEYLKPLVQAKLNAGECVLLLDALDEVPREKQSELKKRVDRFVSNFACPIVCTSRLVGYGGTFLTGAKEVEIVPFAQKQTEQYIETWFKNAAGSIEDESVSAAALIGELRNKPQVGGLARNPLLLSLICSLYQTKGLTLPARRAQVYEAAVKYMLGRWSIDNNRQAVDHTWIDIKIELLEELAYQFSCEDKEVFSNRDLRKKIDRYLKVNADYTDFSNLKASDLIAELLERDGILQKLYDGSEQYLFLHRTFQEYLTACYLSHANNNIALAKAHFWNFDWHETLSLMAGLMDKPIDLIQAILDEKDDIFKTMLLLSGRCVAECGAIDSVLVDEICDQVFEFWLKYPEAEFIQSVIGAVGQSASQVAAKLQDALQHENSLIRQYAAKALGQIGSTQAVDALIRAHYVDENRFIRHSMAEALVRIGSTQAINALIQELHEQDLFCYSAESSAAKALGKTNSAQTAQVINALVQTLYDAHSAEAECYAAESLGEIGSPKAIDALIQILRDGYYDTKLTTIEELEKIGSTQAVNALIQALQDEDERIRSSASFSLGEIGSTQAVNALIQTLHDENYYVIINTVKSLGQIGSPLAKHALVKALNNKYTGRKSDRKYIRFHILKALGRTGLTQFPQTINLALLESGCKL